MKTSVHGSGGVICVTMKNEDANEYLQLFLQESHPECHECPDDCENCKLDFDKATTSYAFYENHVTGNQIFAVDQKKSSEFMEVFKFFIYRVREAYKELNNKKGAWFDGSQN